VKDALKDATAAAYDLGVRGVPTLRVGDTPFFGDDRLDEALAALAAG
jgi:2-hydroxychromene-2-carboxylate isomerase